VWLLGGRWVAAVGRAAAEEVEVARVFPSPLWTAELEEEELEASHWAARVVWAGKWLVGLAAGQMGWW